MSEAFEQTNQNKGCAQAPVRAPSFSCTQNVLTDTEDTLILLRNQHNTVEHALSDPMCQYMRWLL